MEWTKGAKCGRLFIVRITSCVDFPMRPECIIYVFVYGRLYDSEKTIAGKIK